MGLRGPVPTPIPVLRARGSKRGIYAADELVAPVERPTCPAWLCEEAKKEWRRQTAWLVEMGLLARCDRAALAAFCAAWAEFAKAQEQLDKQGPLIRDGDGVAPHPLLAVRDRAADRVIKLSAHFGFTPSARARLRAAARQPEEASRDGEGPPLYKIHG